MMRTDTPATSAKERDAPPPNTSQTRTVAAATAMTTGTKTAVMRSTSDWIGSFAPWAACTIATIWAKVASDPTCSTRTSSAPAPLTVPPVTRMPSVFSTGSASPVSMDSSTWDWPSSTTPSAAIFSPGRMAMISPTRKVDAGRITQLSPSRTRASFGARSIRARMACPARPLARASIQRPRRISVTMTAAASK